MARPRVAVVGHVEWVRFLEVDGAPHAGAILRAPPGWDEPAGGGGVAAAAVAELVGACLLVTALGDDAVGQGIPDVLARAGVTVVGPTRAAPHRQAVTLLDPSGERTIVVIGPAQAASGDEVADVPFEQYDAVYFCKGDAALLRRARAARVLVATARVRDVVAASGVRLDALVRSGRDPAERYEPGDLHVPPDLVATTDGAHGGAWSTATAAGRWDAVPLPGRPRDAYGAGDRFAAGLTVALALGHPAPEAVRLAAASGARALTVPGAGIAAPPGDGSRG